jgi:RNA polymerase sigma factor for flagellar operon FliA
VHRIAIPLKRRLPANVSLCDLISCGWVGFLDASSRRRPGMDDDEFEAFAAPRVRGAMLDHLRQMDPLVRNARRASTALERTAESLSGRLGRAPTGHELVDGVTRDLGRGPRESVRDVELGSVRARTSDPVPVESIPDPREGPEEIAERNLLMDRIRAAAAGLAPRLRSILNLRYFEHLSPRQVAAALHVGESRARQLEADALRRIRAALGVRRPGPLVRDTGASAGRHARSWPRERSAPPAPFAIEPNRRAQASTSAAYSRGSRLRTRASISRKPASTRRSSSSSSSSPISGRSRSFSASTCSTWWRA